MEKMPVKNSAAFDKKKASSQPIEESKASRVSIQIVDYDQQWPMLFQREADRVQAVLGPELMLMEHVGSTSVPGLPAKPIIDLVIAVADSADEERYAAKLASGGYILHVREPNWHEHRMFKGPDTDVNLHVFSRGCPEIGRMLMFRDWLRRNAADRDYYARTKLRLARKTWGTVQDYADAKTGVVEEIMQRAVAGFGSL